MLTSWFFEAEETERRADFEARNERRFEAQWQGYAKGLEAFARSHALDRSKNRDQWVATVSDGKPVWLNERTGQTRPSDPLEARVRGTLARERKKQGCIEFNAEAVVFSAFGTRGSRIRVARSWLEVSEDAP